MNKFFPCFSATKNKVYKKQIKICINREVEDLEQDKPTIFFSL